MYPVRLACSIPWPALAACLVLLLRLVPQLVLQPHPPVLPVLLAPSQVQGTECQALVPVLDVANHAPHAPLELHLVELEHRAQPGLQREQQWVVQLLPLPPSEKSHSGAVPSGQRAPPAAGAAAGGGGGALTGPGLAGGGPVEVCTDYGAKDNQLGAGAGAVGGGVHAPAWHSNRGGGCTPV